MAAAEWTDYILHWALNPLYGMLTEPDQRARGGRKSRNVGPDRLLALGWSGPNQLLHMAKILQATSSERYEDLKPEG